MKTGPTWEELEDWCKHQPIDFAKMRQEIVQRSANREAQRCLDEMRRLNLESSKLTGPAWMEMQHRWDAAFRAHERAIQIAFPEKTP